MPLQGVDPVAFTYDHPAFRAAYKQGRLPGDVLPLGENFTALRVGSKSSGPNLSGYVAAVPASQIRRS